MAVLEGRVVDEVTGTPVPYMGVTVDGYPAVSDPGGRFRIDMPAGTYTMKVRSPAYAPVTLRVSVPGTVEVRVRRVLL